MLQPSLFDEAMPKPEPISENQRFMNLLKVGMKMPCPCCGRHSQIYRRTVHYSMAWQLIKLYQLTRIGGHISDEYVDAAQLILPGTHGTGDFPKCRYWGLIERKPANSETEGKSSGLWRLTEQGVCFIRLEKTIQKTVLVFDDTVIGFDGPQVNIRQAISEKFSYSELMNR